MPIGTLFLALLLGPAVGGAQGLVESGEVTAHGRQLTSTTTVSWVLVSTNNKCAENHLRLWKKTQLATVEMCAQACANDANCGYFSHMLTGVHAGDCMGCRAETDQEGHTGFNFYRYIRQVVGAQGDPHLALPHSGKADFRGEDKALYNFLSAPGLSLNVMTELADFELHPENSSRHKSVHGSFLTQAHVVARTSQGTTVRVSFYADKIGARNIAWANGTIDSQPAFKLGPKMKKAVDDVTLHTDYSSLHVLNPEYELIITPNLFRLERNVVGLHHRLDIQAKLRVDERDLSVPPHGIIGQAWDGDGLAIDGETDAFPNLGEFTTYAMAKGAIEGAPNDYTVAKPYATDFKFSRFDATSGAPRDVAKLVAAGVLNVPRKVLTGEGFVGATENHIEL